MLKRIFVFVSLALCAGTVLAAPPAHVDLEELKADMLQARQQFSPPASTTAVTEAEVGDVDSFGKNKVYLGVEQTQPVWLQADCSPPPPATIPPGVTCIETDATGSAFVNEYPLGSIELPGSATDSFLCFTFTQFSTWIWNNTSAANALGNMGLSTTVQIENDVLLGLFDADGDPFNGTLWPFPIPIVVATSQTTLPAGAVELQRERVTRSCTGGLVSARLLRAEGLTENQIKDFFKEPMTITFGTQGNVSRVEFAQFFAGIRIYGDK